ncbi:hypothetical protein IC582_005193 [Cucumis melo]
MFNLNNNRLSRRHVCMHRRCSNYCRRCMQGDVRGQPFVNVALTALTKVEHLKSYDNHITMSDCNCIVRGQTSVDG